MEQLRTNGNGANAGDADAAIAKPPEVSVLDAERAVKRERKNLLERIRRVVRKDGVDLHYYGGEYYLAPIHWYDTIDVEVFGRKVGAISSSMMPVFPGDESL
jgi:hypothetical protein